VLSREIYVTAALAGAASFVAGSAVGLHREVAVVVGLLIGFGLRGAAIQRGWTLPRYRARRYPPNKLHAQDTRFSVSEFKRVGLSLLLAKVDSARPKAARPLLTPLTDPAVSAEFA